MNRLRASAFCLAGLSIPVAVAAQTCGYGLEFTVNTYTTDTQRSPAIGASPDGTFVIAWYGNGSLGNDSSYSSVQARRYAANGLPIDGAEFQVNSDTLGVQVRPDVAIDGAGRFLILWTHIQDPSTADGEVRGQLYAADATAVGDEFQVNSVTLDSQSHPSLGFDASGGFVAAWQSRASAGSDTQDYSIQARRFAADATPLGDDFQVNTTTLGTQELPRVAVDGDGTFVIVWTSLTSAGTDSSGYSIQGQRFGADGTPEGGEFQVNSYTTENQVVPDVKLLPDGDFLVVWGSQGSFGPDTEAYSIQARRFASDGTPDGPEFQVNSDTTNSQRGAVLAVDTDGGFIVTWQSFGADGHSWSVVARSFDANGAPRGQDAQVNLREWLDQKSPAIALHTDGSYLVAWESEDSPHDFSEFGISLRRFHSRPLLCDGFESGDTSAWSTTVP